MSDESTVVLNIENMKCNGCLTAVKKALEQVVGVKSVNVSLENNTATVMADCEPDELARVVAEAGYPAKVAKT